MKKLYFSCIYLILVMALLGCTTRSTSYTPSAAEENSSDPKTESSSEIESEPESEIESETESADEISEEENVPEEDPYPAPILGDKEKTMLAEDLSFFVELISRENVPITPNEFSKDAILTICLEEIERSKEINAYFFEQNDKKADMIPASFIVETAERLFGIPAFAHTESSLYDKQKACYIYVSQQANKKSEFTASEIKGAPDDRVAYDVTFTDGSIYTYTAEVLRQNSMPYLRFVSLDKTL